MQRLPKILFFVGIVLLAGILLVRFRDYAIEESPDGNSLGIVTAAEFRSASLVVISVPLVVMAAFILSAKRFGPRRGSGR